MSCQLVRENIHQYLDRELPAAEVAIFDRHFVECRGCREVRDDFLWMKEALSVEASLPGISEDQLWNRIQARVSWRLGDRLFELWNDVCIFGRDLDRRLVWSKLMASPITLGFLMSLLLQFPQVSFQEVKYPVLSLFRSPASVFARAVVTEVPVRQEGAPINGLVNTAWKIPYEDSLALVAEITPEGYAQIDDVLQYPKNQELLKAVNLTLRRTQFEAASDLRNPFLIYSFHKIDVYGEQRGL